MQRLRKIKTKYKILIIVAILAFIYWPIMPLIALSCQQLTDDKICFDIAGLRFPAPYDVDIWDKKDGWK